ncbi:acyl-CoA dehydrogenase family protein [Nocardia sp. NPDC051981]|uniref:acyl-CoA dehydrogenase family protein n=1 Tax=Nocardia sp. NPDC051981 TaxID=3155417 RepID=UPI00341AAFC4
MGAGGVRLVGRDEFEAEVERHYRDVRILGIGGGASEVMTDLAAKVFGYLR